MTYEETLKAIFGEDWERYQEVGTKILAYCDANPLWNNNAPIPLQNALRAIDKALKILYGHPLEYYLKKTKEQEYSFMRIKIVGILRQQGFTLPQIASALGYKNHTSILYLERQNENSTHYDAKWRKEFIRLKEETNKNL